LKENTLDDDGVRANLIEKFGEVVMESGQSTFQRVFRWCLEDPRTLGAKDLSEIEIATDRTESTTSQTWIDANYEHMFDCTA
jgi:hypothetical protein